jgi:hypothetical protein
MAVASHDGCCEMAGLGGSAHGAANRPIAKREPETRIDVATVPDEGGNLARPIGQAAGREWFRRSAVVWAGLVGCIFLSKALFTYFIPMSPAAGHQFQESALTWPALVGMAVLGLAGLWFADRTGFPTGWDQRVSNRNRLVLPVLIGLVSGLVMVALDRLFNIGATVAAANNSPTLNIAFPGSLFAYASGGLWSEVLFRYLPLPLLLFLISNVALGGRSQVKVFWVLAILLAGLEPAVQTLPAMMRPGASIAPLAMVAGLEFVVGLVQNVLFRRYGFLASYGLRIGHYSVWHIIYGNFICQC